ncbi:MAG: GntG family PLP-dependent aldolase [Fimbriimonas sp.]|nr:GntG family PLP-dependent aldolase [Fimbriimonas sp.]
MSSPAFPTDVLSLVDLRSDTVTRPTPEMYEAMANAPLGDDVLGDDPTVIELETLAAEMTDKEASLFVPSGTMSNQIALAAHCERGDAILIEEEAHILYYEVGAPALLAGVVSWTLPSNRGAMDPEQIKRRILKRDLHTPGTALLCLENTHNRAGGAIIPLETMEAYRGIADLHGIKIHLDGARVFNAAVALGVPVHDITRCVDTVSVCLSKGLRSPIGSVLCGPTELIDKARIWRKRLGGGMRQAGILAACGIVSLTKMVDRLAEDHARAKNLAGAIGGIPGISVDLETVETNMVLVTTEAPATDWQVWLKQEGLLCFPVGANRLRLVFHGDIDDDATSRAIQAFRTVSDRTHGPRGIIGMLGTK